jgi:N-acylneuraminate cytidylyltransferase/CMP-N,N'-diacetyllegionaminic acid synthase
MLAIIPARGGSKGLPGKNTKILHGKPLIAYTIESALKSKHISEVIVSTDDPEIYKVALEFGAKKTFLRPKALAEDNSLAIDNYLYTINKLNSEFGMCISEFVVLQPTSPMRDAEEIDSAIELFWDKDADSVVSYTIESHPITWHKYINTDGTFSNIFENNTKNRQANKPSFYPNGAIFVFRFELLESGNYYSNNSYAYVMDADKSIDIDTSQDFEYAEFLMRKKR